MKTLAFILVIMNNTTIEGEIMFPSFQKCSWYQAMIDYSKAGKVHNYSAYCKPVVITKREDI